MILTVTLNPALDITYRVDSVVPHATHRVRQVAERPGGKGVNVANLVHRLGEALYIGGMYWAVTPYLGHPPVFGSNFAMRREAWAELSPDVHRGNGIHDDLDLSFRLDPAHRILFVPGLSVGMSPRALRAGRPAVRRLARAVRTIRLNWADERPWERWQARLGRRGDGA